LHVGNPLTHFAVGLGGLTPRTGEPFAYRGVSEVDKG
jgi:hypothetical protein